MPGFNINGTGEGPYANVEPMRAHRWKIEFSGNPRLQSGSKTGFLFSAYALSCQRPTVQIEIIKMHNSQNQVHLPGKHFWNPINVKFYDVAPDSDNLDEPALHNGGQWFSSTTTAQEIFKWWSDLVVNFSSNTISSSWLDVQADIKQTVGSTGGVTAPVHGYTLYRVWPSKVEPSELSYAVSDIATVNVTLSYDVAEETGNAGAKSQ